MPRKTETTLMHRILLACSKAGARLFRNNVGVAHHADGSRVVYGLCKGSSDLIGWTPVRITPAMVGQTVAVFTALEVKTGRQRATRAQSQFLTVLYSQGGIASVVKSEDEAVRILDQANQEVAK